MKRQGTNQLIDVAQWDEDTEFSPYPEGSRSKSAVYCPENPPYEFLIPQHRYLFKHSNPNFPAQYWAEIIAYRIGCHMGVHVPPAFAAVNSVKGDTAALIEWFYGPALSTAPPPQSAIVENAKNLYRRIFGLGVEAVTETVRYVPGSNYMIRLIKGYDLRRGTQHNVTTLFDFCHLLQMSWGLSGGFEHWAKIFIFDAIIGNTDRHQDNWGILWHGVKRDVSVAEFAPAFDNGTALGHEIMDEKLAAFEAKKRIEAYVSRGRHHFRWERGDAKRCGHIELVQRLALERPNLHGIMLECLQFDMGDLEASIKELCEIDSPLKLSLERAAFVFNLICERKSRLEQVLENIHK